ncbi:MAG: glycerol-3-phosphate responsive antiterminator [Clostridia bacterium]|nr:glycerol-3-phosphate responsive antiterminator [Clostridia bacterium]
MSFIDRIIEAPVIGAIQTNTLKNVETSPCEVYFVLGGEISELKETLENLKNKIVFVDIDLINGLKADGAGIRFIKSLGPLEGIITTKSHLIKEAQREGLKGIQRLFLLDSKNLESGIASVLKTKPDAVEVLPGVMPKILKKIIKEIQMPVIAGGLITDKEDIVQCLQVGVLGVSTSNPTLWNL